MTIDTVVLLVGIGTYGVVQLVSLHHARKISDQMVIMMNKSMDMLTRIYEKFIND
jgi:hypothetical protein